VTESRADVFRENHHSSAISSLALRLPVKRFTADSDFNSQNKDLPAVLDVERCNSYSHWLRKNTAINNIL